jgi:hypothetical protein
MAGFCSLTTPANGPNNSPAFMSIFVKIPMPPAIDDSFNSIYLGIVLMAGGALGSGKYDIRAQLFIIDSSVVSLPAKAVICTFGNYVICVGKKVYFQILTKLKNTTIKLNS